MSAIRVLLGDDHRIVREITAEVVDHQPDMCVVGQAGTGEEVVALAREKQPDVVVVDIAMSRLDGLEAIRQIVVECPGCQVLVLTTYDDESYVIQLLEAGAVGYLPKTVGMDELLEAIRATAQGETVLPPAVATVMVRHLTGGEAPEELTCLLTDRELKVLRLVAQGLTNCDIAQRLCISVRTVEAHLTHVYNKLGVGSRTEAVLYAVQQGWIQPEEQQHVPL